LKRSYLLLKVFWFFFSKKNTLSSCSRSHKHNQQIDKDPKQHRPPGRGTQPPKEAQVPPNIDRLRSPRRIVADRQPKGGIIT